MYAKFSAALCIPFFLFTGYFNYVSGQSYFQLLKQDHVCENIIVEKYGTLANNLADIIINRNDINFINSFKYGTTISREKELTDNPNFVMIQVESMDSNIINHMYMSKYIMPYLHSLSKNSVYFPYVLSYHKAGGTSDCEFSIINSIEPLDSFPSMKISNYNYPNSIVQMLASASYSTAAFHGNLESYFNRDKAFAKMGFAEFHDMVGMELDHIGWGAPDNEVFRYALNVIKNQPEPFFSYIITMTSHGPYTNARHYYNNSSFDGIKNEVVRNYFNSMSYVDHTIEEFVSGIKSNQKNTYIFIWGDHTPNIDNSYYKQSSFSMDDKYFEFVPLIIITPDNKTYFENRNTASFLDFAPTILQISGIPFNYKTNGRNLSDIHKEPDKIPYRGTEYDRSFLYEKITRGVP